MPKGGFGGGACHLLAHGESGKLGLAPHCQGSALPAQAPAWCLALEAVSIIGARQQSSLLGLSWGGVICSPIHGFLQSDLRGPQRNTATQNAGPARKPDSPLACCRLVLIAPALLLEKPGSRPCLLFSCPSSSLHRALTLVCHTLIY